MAKMCSIEGCDKRSRCRGWCDNHYSRWLRNGDPLAGRTPDGAPAEFIEGVLSSETDDCLEWPYSLVTGGYGSFFRDGRSTTAHRVVCERANGPQPTNLHEVAHGCGNRSCVNPRHLRWATRSENHADKLAHGTAQRGERHPNSRLTDKQVSDIRGRRDQSLSSLAKEFGITKQAVFGIRKGKAWKHVA